MENIQELVKEGEEILFLIRNSMTISSTSNQTSFDYNIDCKYIFWYDSVMRYLNEKDKITALDFSDYCLKDTLDEIRKKSNVYGIRFRSNPITDSKIPTLKSKCRDDLKKQINILKEYYEVSIAPKLTIELDRETNEYHYNKKKVEFNNKTCLFYKLFDSMYKVRQDGEIKYSEIINRYKEVHGKAINKKQILRSLMTKGSSLYKGERLEYKTKKGGRLIKPIKGRECLYFDNKVN